MSSPAKDFPIAPLPRRGSLVDGILAVLRARVLSGELAVGEQLPAESRLAEAFEVSRAIVREALARLKQEGLVQSHQGRGVFVVRTTIDPPSIFDQGRVAGGLKLKDILEVRLAVEPVAAALAANRWTDGTLAPIADALSQLRQATESGDGGPEFDHRFHLSIAQATGNPLFVSLLEFLGQDLVAAIRTARENTRNVTGRPAMVHREHEAIYESILARDAVAASDAMRSHLRRAATRLSVRDGEMAP